MTPLILLAALAGQYPSPQAPQTYAAPVTYAAAPVTYAAPQVVMLGAGQVVQPGPFGLMLGSIGQRLQKHAWPRVQPMTVQAPPVTQTVYLQLSVGPPQVQQAVYTAPQAIYAAPPPQSPMKAPPTTYGTPQAPQYGSAPQLGAPKPSESVPPVPPR